MKYQYYKDFMYMTLTWSNTTLELGGLAGNLAIHMSHLKGLVTLRKTTADSIQPFPFIVFKEHNSYKWKVYPWDTDIAPVCI